MVIDLLANVPKSMRHRYSLGFAALPQAAEPTPERPPSGASPNTPVGITLPISVDAKGGAALPYSDTKRRRLPQDLRIYLAIFKFLESRPMLRLLRVYPKLRHIVILLLRRRCEHSLYDERMKICSDCSAMVVGAKDRWFCRDCGCPHWWGSELRRKNKLGGQHCPHKLHPGEYPPGYEIGNPLTCAGRSRGREMRIRQQAANRTRRRELQ
jgi:hypothetical protein